MEIFVIFPRSQRALLVCDGIFAIAMLLLALGAQYGFSLHPCELCIAQRYPYAAIALLASLCYFTGPRGLRLAVLTCIILFAVDSAIAFYHAGVELHLFTGPSGCTNSASSGESLAQMRAELLNAPLVNCDQAMIKIFGLSMAAWNFVAAFAAFLANIFFWRSINKHPQ